MPMKKRGLRFVNNDEDLAAGEGGELLNPNRSAFLAPRRRTTMRRVFLVAALALGLCAGGLRAFDVVGIFKKVEADKGVVQVNAGGQDRTLKIAKDVKVLDNDGKPLADGLQSKELKDGTEV